MASLPLMNQIYFWMSVCRLKDVHRMSQSGMMIIKNAKQYPVVLIPVFDFIPNLTDRQIIYTAITRAKEMVVLAGDYKKLQMMIRNIRSVKRYTRLEYLLKARS